MMAILAILVCYLSWIPDPDMVRIHWMPSWIARWADEYPRLRTGVPFVLLGALAGGGLVARRARFIHWIGVWMLLCLWVVIAETGQLLLPHRVFDLADIAWGGAGGIAGLALAAGIAGIVKTVRRFRKSSGPGARKSRDALQ